MASDGVPVSLPASLVQGSQAPTTVAAKAVSGKVLSQNGSGFQSPARQATASSVAAQAVTKTTVSGAIKKTDAASQPKAPTASNKAELAALLQQLNKYLNDSGRAFEFRVAPDSSNQTIQEINPSSGEVVAEYSVSQFPALAQSLGVSGVLVNDRA